MAQIYESNFPPVNLVRSSIWTFLFANDRFPQKPDYPAFIDPLNSITLTRGELKRRTLQLAWGARHLLPKLGGPKLKRGSTIMILSPNSIAWPILLFGNIAAGFKCTLANSGYTPSELLYQWRDSRAELVYVHPDLLPVVLEMFALAKITPTAAKKKIVITSFAYLQPLPSGYVTMDQLMGPKSLEQEERFDGPLADETALLCYSSGTTGKPKGVESSHHNVTSNLQMSGSMCDWLLHGRDVNLSILPMYHIYGAVQTLQYCFLVGTPVVVMPKFDPIQFFANIEKYRITHIYLVPPILVALAKHPAVDKYDLTSLKSLFSGAAPLGGSLVTAVKQRLKARGVDATVSQGYGLTETSPITHCLLAEHSTSKVGSIGWLLPNLQARLVDEQEDGTVIDVPRGEPGEIWVKGPNIMKGYLNNKQATKNCLTPDRWLKTGDVAIVDKEGFFYIVDRRKELIKYKGFQVPPAELESVLLQNPDVADAAVIGVYSPEQETELPRGYIVSAKPLKSQAEKDALALKVRKWVETKVAKHKFLRGGVVVIDAIPKSASGKILRKDLREQAKKEVAESKKPKAKL